MDTCNVQQSGRKPGTDGQLVHQQLEEFHVCVVISSEYTGMLILGRGQTGESFESKQRSMGRRNRRALLTWLINILTSCIHKQKMNIFEKLSEMQVELHARTK